MADLNRRALLRLAGTAATGSIARAAEGEPAAVSLFNGRTMDGWVQIENNAT
jgi:hypothetical protein